MSGFILQNGIHTFIGFVILGYEVTTLNNLISFI